jgi:hypothetical protein
MQSLGASFAESGETPSFARGNCRSISLPTKSGIGGSLQAAQQNATSGPSNWLMSHYRPGISAK